MKTELFNHRIFIGFSVFFGILVAAAHVVVARDVYYNLQTNYFCSAPDGVTICHTLGVNGQSPGPKIEANIGDTLHVTLRNDIQLRYGVRQNTTMHAHGIFMKGTPFEDGPDMVTQCPIPWNHEMVYKFKLEQSGTYWYHSHVHWQYSEGMLGPLIVHNLPEVYAADYDDEIVIILSDWYHTSGHVNTEWFLSPASGGNEPIPFSVLLNGHGKFPCEATQLPCDPSKQNPPVFRVQKGKRYRIRVINTSAITAFSFAIDKHELTVIEVDGVDTVKVNFDRIPVIAPAQRYSFIVAMNGEEDDEFCIKATANLEMFAFDEPNINPDPEALIPTVTAILKYESVAMKPGKKPRFGVSNAHGLSSLLGWALPGSHNGHAQGQGQGQGRPSGHGQGHGQGHPKPRQVCEPDSEDEDDDGFPDEKLLRPYDRIPSPANFDKEIIFNVDQYVDDAGINYLTFNDIVYRLGEEPLLVTVLQDRPIPVDANSYEIEYNQVVQIVINNHDTGSHPFHLHGHTFWVLGVGATNASDYDSTRDELTLIGVRRDTVQVQAESWAVIRFVADNPGVWYFHCHINWHLQSGLAATVIEATEQMRDTIHVTDEAIRICKAQGLEISKS